MPKIDARNICLIRTSALGDTVHALAFINGLRKGYPHARLTWILQNVPYDMVKHQPGIDRFIPFDRKGGFLSWISLLRNIRRDSYDLLIVPQYSAKASLLALFVRAGIKIGYDRKRSDIFHQWATHRHIPARPVRHARDQFFEFLEYLKIADFDGEPEFCFTEAELKWRESFFSALGRPVAGFVVSSSNPDKDWAPGGYARVIDYVEASLGLRSMLIGGPAKIEAESARRILDLCRTNPLVALDRPIRRTLLYLSGCRIVVSPDTGPLHMAVALNVPTVGLYGYSDPRRCGPYRKYQDLLIDKYHDPGHPAQPVTRITRPGRMQLITPEEVIAKIEYGLNAYPPAEIPATGN